MDPMTLAMLGTTALQTIGGIAGSNSAAGAQEDAAKKAAEAQNRALMAQLGMIEPQRQIGYQALGDLASLYGYTQAPYTTIGQLQQTLTPITQKQVRQGLKQGMSFEQISQMGTLGTLGQKALKRLTRAGLTPEQIQQLQSGVQQSPAPAAPAPAASSGTAGNMDRFFASPDYQFRLQEGSKAVDRSAAARGGALSGNALRAQTEYAGNLASGEFGNYYNRLLGLAGIGTPQATQAVGNMGAANAQMQQQIGDARASGVMGAVNTASNAINNGMSLYALQNAMRQPADPMNGLAPVNIWQKRI